MCVWNSIGFVCLENKTEKNTLSVKREGRTEVKLAGNETDRIRRGWTDVGTSEEEGLLGHKRRAQHLICPFYPAEPFPLLKDSGVSFSSITINS